MEGVATLRSFELTMVSEITFEILNHLCYAPLNDRFGASCHKMVQNRRFDKLRVFIEAEVKLRIALVLVFRTFL